MKHTDFLVGAIQAIQDIDFPIQATPAVQLDDTASAVERFHNGERAALGGQLVAREIRIVTGMDEVIG